MKHIKTWRERVNEGDSIFAKATALEAEVAELRAHIAEIEPLLIDSHAKFNYLHLNAPVPRNVFTAEMVHQLRHTTGKPIMDCKKALIQCNGDMAQAADYLHSGRADYGKLITRR